MISSFTFSGKNTTFDTVFRNRVVINKLYALNTGTSKTKLEQTTRKVKQISDLYQKKEKF